MKKFLEKVSHIIIPHKKNNNIPHILKREFIFVLAVFVGVLFYFNQNNFDIIRKLNLGATVYPAVLADLANSARVSSDIPELTWSPTLEKAAKLKAQDMLDNGYFAHTSPTGVTPWYWFKQANYNFVYAGENLAVDFTESTNVEQAWLNSPKHRENILNSHFTEIGIATVDGYFEGKNTTFVVELFGKPSVVKSLPVAAAVSASSIVATTNKTITPTVAGASVESKPKDDLKVLEETKDFIVVKNNTVSEVVEASEVPAPVVSSDIQNKYMSTWASRFIFNPTGVIKIIYISIFILLLIAIVFVLSKEYRDHNTKHITMGVILMTLISILLYIVSVS